MKSVRQTDGWTTFSEAATRSGGGRRRPPTAYAVVRVTASGLYEMAASGLVEAASASLVMYCCNNKGTLLLGSELDFISFL